YLLINCPAGTALIHMGMTGYLRLVTEVTLPGKHDHFDIIFKNGIVLRLNDVRRFGSVIWAGSNPQQHALLAELGPEPLTGKFNGVTLYQKSRGRKITIKQFLMDHKVVAGIGNIYANEALFHAGILPTTPAGQLTKTRIVKLVAVIKAVLANSIRVGGTMLDLRDGVEKFGYFHQELMVYRRSGLPCVRCSTLIQQDRLGKRSIYYCKKCQR
ncbi:MAG: bifunctional DNA-formamidopyrimidine glycosylase/DNA-(apurinic or apyrimidinic site) lyase, partial [Desulfuromonadaceae bacterium]|nr:bifunctional DNA-formamidopyrimidine glycosylase/DNA-(apurinic or apyrimidinic site) lyase [Desulfuromonadaceae bacterium]